MTTDRSGKVKIKTIDVFLCSDNYGEGGAHSSRSQIKFQSVLQRWRQIISDNDNAVALHVMRPLDEADWRIDPSNPGAAFYRKLGTDGSYAVNVKSSRKEFDRLKRITAERLADETLPWYVIADDDYMPMGFNFMQNALSVLREDIITEGYGILEANQKPELTIRNNLIIESYSATGIRFVRRGVFPKDPDQWPMSDPIMPYDEVYSSWMRPWGFRTGIIQSVICRQLT